MNEIDKKIETSLLHELQGLKASIPEMSIEEIRSQVNDKLDTCTKTELSKLLKRMIKWEEDSLDPDLIDERVFDED
jgi:hypothetical protein